MEGERKWAEFIYQGSVCENVNAVKEDSSPLTMTTCDQCNDSFLSPTPSSVCQCTTL